MASEDFKKELLTTMFAQKTVILTTTVVIFACSVLIAFFWPPTYASYGSILVKIKKPLRSPEAIEDAQVRYTDITMGDLSSEVEILTSPDVIEKTIEYLKANKTAPLKSGSATGLLDRARDGLKRLKRMLLPSKTIGGEKHYSQEVYDIQGSLKTSISPLSNVIEVSFYDKDRDYALTLLNALMNQYILHRMQIYYPEEAKEFFSLQAGEFAEELEKKRKEWIDVVEKGRIADPLKEIENNLTLKKELETTLNSLKSTAIEKKLDIEYLDRALANKDIKFFSFLDKLSFTHLSDAIQALYMEYGAILRKYKPTSDRAMPIEKQMNDALGSLRTEVKVYRDGMKKELEAANQKITEIQKTIQELTSRNVELQKQNINSQKIAMEMGLLKLSYETFAKRKEEAVSGVDITRNSTAKIKLKISLKTRNPFA